MMIKMDIMGEESEVQVIVLEVVEKVTSKSIIEDVIRENESFLEREYKARLERE